MRAAVAAAEIDNKLEIAVISKHHPLRSHSVCAQGGTGAVMRDKDSFDLHAFDTIKGADYLADQDVVEFFVRQAPKEIVSIEHWGCPWSRTPEGKIDQRAFGGHSFPRACFAADMTGFHEMQALYAKATSYGNIKFYDEWFVTSIITENKTAVGATAIEMKTGQMHALTAKAIIMATGGYERIHHFLAHHHRRRNGYGLPRRSPTRRHGVRAVPPNRPSSPRRVDYRRSTRRGRPSAQRQW
jgi:succinate dehydrogenase / fumarate reductase flavoprotein subunit